MDGWSKVLNGLYHYRTRTSVELELGLCVPKKERKRTVAINVVTKVGCESIFKVEDFF